MALKTRRTKNLHCQITESQIFGIQSKKRLAEILGWRGPPSRLPKFGRLRTNYSRYLDRAKPQKPRLVEAPQERLKTMQKTLEGVLKRIEPPPYLHSGTPGRSYLSNSLAHRDSPGCTVTLDISDFFQSVTEERITRLFIRTFGCARDVAEILASLVCCDGHLATGSPASPLLSWLANKDVFDAIAGRASASGATFTLYMDDIALTGRGIGHGDIRWVTRLLLRSGLVVKRQKTRVYRAAGPKLITGRAMMRGESRAPHGQHLKMKQAIDAASASPNDQVLKRSAVGRLRHVAQLDDQRRAKLKNSARALADT